MDKKLIDILKETPIYNQPSRKRYNLSYKDWGYKNFCRVTVMTGILKGCLCDARYSYGKYYILKNLSNRKTFPPMYKLDPTEVVKEYEEINIFNIM